MMRAGVTGNAIEICMSRSDAALLALSALILCVLLALAGWQVATIALGLSIAGAGVIGAVQQLDARSPDNQLQWGPSRWRLPIRTRGF